MQSGGKSMRLTGPALVALISLAGAAPAISAEKTLSVSGPGCDYKIRFDPAKVDEKKLKTTADLLLGEGLPGPDYAGRPTTDAVTPAMVEADRKQCLAPLGKTRGMFKAFKDEYQKASGGSSKATK